jgi:hypothetical protein
MVPGSAGARIEALKREIAVIEADPAAHPDAEAKVMDMRIGIRYLTPHAKVALDRRAHVKTVLATLRKSAVRFLDDNDCESLYLKGQSRDTDLNTLCFLLLLRYNADSAKPPRYNDAEEHEAED